MNGLFSAKKVEQKILTIPVKDICSNPNQPRNYFNENALEQLAKSIAVNGLLQPIVVRDMGNNKYELIAGERRLMATCLLKQECISAIVKDVDSQKSSILALIENIQREDLNFFEEAVALQKLLIATKESQQQLATRLGKNQSTIANKLRLLKIPADAMEKILQFGLTERHARALLCAAEQEDLMGIITYIGKHELNVVQTEAFLNRLVSKRQGKNKRTLIIKDVRIFINSIEQAIDVMKESGIHAVSSKTENGEYVTYTVTIPKTSVYQDETLKMKSTATT